MSDALRSPSINDARTLAFLLRGQADALADYMEALRALDAAPSETEAATRRERLIDSRVEYDRWRLETYRLIDDRDFNRVYGWPECFRGLLRETLYGDVAKLVPVGWLVATGLRIVAGESVAVYCFSPGDSMARRFATLADEIGRVVSDAPDDPPAATTADGPESSRREDPVVPSGSNDVEAETPKKIDFTALASALRKASRPIRAALVEYMADRLEATSEEVADKVHGDVQASWKAVMANVRRTNDSLAELGSTLRFKAASSHVYRETIHDVAGE